MAALLALVATILTSFLPILNKRLLRDSGPALVAWIINAASLPILGAGTLLLTQCSMTPLRGSLSLACAVHIPRIDGLFVEEARTGLLAPLRLLLHRPGTLLAIAASALWGTTTVLEKLAIDHMTPPSGPAVALIGTFLLVALLTQIGRASCRERV